MYTLAHLQEIGNDLPLSTLNGDDNVSMFTWFLLVFWLNVGAMMIAGRGMFGDILPRREHSLFRKWWKQHSYGILVGTALITGLAVRTGWNVLPATNAFELTSGICQEVQTLVHETRCRLCGIPKESLDY